MRPLHHIALGANEPATLAAWYQQLFDLPEVDRHHADGRVRSVWLSLGDGAVLMIERTGRTRPEVDGVDAGPFLLAFEVAEEEHDELARRLEAAGATIEDRTEYTSYARDPEGNRIAISHYVLPTRGDFPPS